MKHYALAGCIIILFCAPMQYAEKTTSPNQCASKRSLQIPVSLGELIDKITILEIKLARMTDQKKRKNVRKELRILTEALTEYGTVSSELIELKKELLIINEQLWDIEDDIRAKEAAQKFDQEFIALARRVYIINDRRSATKRKINEYFGSALIEEKEYTNYDIAQTAS